jgi:transcriptional antiterminator RfaH
MADSGWACAHTRSGEERRAVENLARQGYEAFCPLQMRPSRSDVRKAVSLPLFPCYVFVLIAPDQRWRSINSTYGVIRLLTSHGTMDPRPLFVRDEKVAEIRALAQTVADPMPPGTVVRVRQRSSPLYDMVGEVVRMDGTMRVSVLMSIFNRDTVVEFVNPNDLAVVA